MKQFFSINALLGHQFWEIIQPELWKCFNYGNFKFDACYRSQNSWDGACLPWSGISSSFQNSLKTSGHRSYEFQCWNLVLFLPDIGFLLLKSLLWSWCIFHLMMSQMFFIGERSGLQVGQFSTWTLLLRSHAVVIAAVCGFALSCWNTQDLPWNRCRLEGSICCFKTFNIPFSIHSAFQNMQAAHTVCTYAPPYHQRCWLLNWMLITHWKVSLNEPWPTGHDGASGLCSHTASFLHDKL